MEHSVAGQTCKKLASILLFLSICCALLSLPSHAMPDATAVPEGLIQNSMKQQVLASIPPGTQENAAAFITSPAGKYTAYLLRRQTTMAADGYGNDLCYIQIQDASSGAGVWESECEPVSSSNACSVVFDGVGLEVLDGSNSVWDASSSGNNNYPATLEMVDEGDMRITDKDGQLVWRASDYPRVNQGCGLPGSPELAPESPPFSGNGNPPFSQQPSQTDPQLGAGGNGQQQQQQQQPVGADQGQQTPVQTPPQMTDGSYGQLSPPPLPPMGADQGQQPPVQTPPQMTDGGNGQQQQQQQQLGAGQGPVQAPPQVTDGGNGQQQPFGNEQPPVQAPSQLTGGASGRQQTLQSSNGVNQATEHGAQPLVDNNRYDSGCSRNGGLLGICFAVITPFAFQWLLV